MKVDPARHRARPWRVHSLAPDFELLDVWRVPIEADPSRGETFDRFFDLAWENEVRTDSRVVGALTEIRSWIGRVLAWDGTGHSIPGSNERSIATRLTDEDRRADRSRGLRPKQTNAGERISLIYRFADEALVETSNATIAALWHFGWVGLPSGKKTLELAVYIKSRGLGSRLYMAAIQPFRHLFVYPSYTRHIARLWRDRIAGAPGLRDAAAQHEVQGARQDG